MDLNGYVIDIDGVIHTIQQKQWKKIFLQLPEGLKAMADVLVDFLTAHTNSIVLVGADPCYGACDTPCNDHLASLGIDAVLQIGHTPIPALETTTDIPLLFVNAQSQKPVIPVVTKALPYLTGKTIGLVSTAQHVHTLPVVQRYLQRHGYAPLIGQGSHRVVHPGQVLGCNFSAARALSSQVDAFLFIGSGTFHALGLILSTQKPVVAADPYTETVNTTELEGLKERLLRQRYGAIAIAQQAKTFGVLIATKPGQQRMPLALQIQKKIQERGRQALLLAVDHLTPMMLQNFPHVECFVSTLCPRIVLDDSLQYKRCFITPLELSIALGDLTWDHYSFDEIT